MEGNKIAKPVLSNSPGLNSILDKLSPFSRRISVDGTPTVEVKLRRVDEVFVLIGIVSASVKRGKRERKNAGNGLRGVGDRFPPCPP